MNKQLNYKGHLIILDGIVATIYDDRYSEYIYKQRFLGYSQVEVIRKLKAFINLRLEQIKRDRSIDIYV